MANKGFFNGEIAGNPFAVYSELKNWDIAPMPHNDRQELDEFALRKRESYRSIWPLTELDMFKGYRFTDAWRNDDIGCGGCEGECCCTFYYAVSSDKTRYAIVKATCTEECTPIIIDCGQRCPCASENFFSIFSRSSDILNDTSNLPYSIGTIENVEPERGLLHVNSDISKNPGGPALGSYVQVIGIENGGEGTCGLINRVLTTETYQGEGDFDYTVVFETPWEDLQVGIQLEGMRVISFDRANWVPGYSTYGGIQTIVGCAEGVDNSGNCDWDDETKIQIGDNICEIGAGECHVSIQQHNGRLSFLDDSGYMNYSLAGSNIVDIDNTNYVGSDKIDSVSFKNFIVNFGRKEINAVVFDNTGSSSFVKELDTNGIGIKNKGAWAKFDSGLYFVGSDNRIYGASLNSNGSTFDIDMKDITTSVRGHMDLIQPDDEVYLSSDSGILYVFINGRDNDNNTNTNKTKILKFYKDFETWGPWHEVCGEVITGLECGQFLGESVYHYCGWDGDGESSFPYEDEFGNTHFYGRGYDAVAEGITYGMTQHGMSSADGIKSNMFRKHKIERGNILLGGGLYTDATRIEVHSADRYVWRRYYKIDTENEWINGWKLAWNCQEVTPTDCFINGLDKCDNISNPCAGSHRNCRDVDPRCSCEGKKRIYEDYCICYDDSSYAISPVESLEMLFDDKWATYHRVRFVSGFNAVTDDNGVTHHINDVGYFMGMILETDSQQGFFNDLDPFTSNCCDPVMECPLDGCNN